MEGLKQLKKIIYLLILIMFLICIISAFNVQVKVGEQDYIIKRISSEEFSSLTFYNCHMSVDEEGNKIYIPDNDDPQVYLSTIEEKINSVRVNFATKLSKDINILLFYCKEGEGFAIQNIADTVAMKGQKSAILFMPEESYAVLRLDIDGIYAIESVDLGIAQNNGYIYRNYYEINYISIILLIFLIIILIAFEKRIKYFQFLKTIMIIFLGYIGKLKIFKYVKNKYFNVDIYTQRKENGINTANCFAAIAFVFGILFIYIIPPMSCPDEAAHFANICRISSGNLFVNKYEEKIGSFLKPEDIDFIKENYNNYALDSFYNTQYSLFSGYERFTYKAQETEFLKDSTANINPMAYFSSVIGVVIAKLLFGISNPYVLLTWARLSNLLFSIFIIHLAIRKTPILRNAMFLIALMPMTIFQFSSVSYDAEVLCGSFLLFAYAMRLILVNDSYRIVKGDIIAVCFSCACLFAAKIVYAPLILVLLSISIKKFGGIKNYIFSISMVVITGILIYLIPTMIISSIVGETQVVPAIQEQREFVLTNLNLIPTIVRNTFVTQKSLLINSFVGCFGQWRIFMPEPLIFSYFGMLFTVMLFELCMVPKMKINTRLLLLLEESIIILGIVLAMYITWTPKMVKGKGSYALGVQGRYFIPIAIYSLPWLANPLMCRLRHLGKINKYLSYISKFVVTGYLLLSSAVLFTAYWL